MVITPKKNDSKPSSPSPLVALSVVEKRARLTDSRYGCVAYKLQEV